MVKVLALDESTGKKTQLALRSVNFSIRRVGPGLKYEVPEDHQMLLAGKIVNEGHMVNNGQVVLIDLEDKDTPAPEFPALPEDNFSHYQVAAGVTKTVPNGQQMHVLGRIFNQGIVKNFGQVIVTKVFQEDPDASIELPGDNFSKREIIANETLTVPSRQQMTVVGPIKNSGRLVSYGMVVQLSAEVPTDKVDDFLPPYRIEQGETYTIGQNRLMYLPMMIQNFGKIVNNGILRLGA